MEVKKEKISRRNKDIRAMILDAALDLFSTRGYFSTSVHHIQKQAGVSIGSIYHHFKNKEAIAKALYDDLVAMMGQSMAEIMASGENSEHRLKAVCAHLFALTESSPKIMQYILYARHREFMPDELPICSSRPFVIIQDMVREGMERGELRQMNLTVASASVMGAAIRLIYLSLDGVLEKPVSSYLDEIWECSWKSVAV
ncbi:TetR/AcrR family transcriptional regulator [Desulfotalea psychrophila]|uniref:TetR/AcrR family transcriptional regulator n=1 Tax=Desulfotalea psychrophila TaxID=84980 RepID=UPI0002FBCCF9|nr:TetR/AcrR family transcriptional regulator [Desulfotalea psychrophila]